MSVLVFNVGSTTLKYAEVDPVSGQSLDCGVVDRIGQPGGDAVDHLSAAEKVLNAKVLAGPSSARITAIGHRIVQGGDCFPNSTVVDEAAIAKLRTLDSLAPLHNPSARGVVEAITGHQLKLPQVLVFDTSYFSTLPPSAYRYAIDEAVYRDHHVRKYGFHGTSHRFVVEQAKHHLSSIDQPRIVSLHLGGGASATASIDGVAVDTSMGMTPLEGLVMATRCGDIDPSVALYLIRHAGYSADQVDRLFNKQSGLLGLCGESDMRSILKRRDAGDPKATLAIEIYVRRIIKKIGGYAAIMGGLDALVFTAGVGERSSVIRSLICEPLGFLGVQLDANANDHVVGVDNVTDISIPDAAVRTLVVPTNEELAIARETVRILG